MILEEALKKIIQLDDNSSKATGVYHFSFLGFPLTHNKDTI